MSVLKIKYASRAARLIAAATVVVAPLLLVQPAQAANLTQALVRFDRMKIGQATTGTVCAKPATAATEASVQVAFPTGYTVSTTVGNWTTSTTNLSWPAGATAWLGIGTATAAVGQVVTFPSTDLVVGTLYCFNWTNTAAVSVKATATTNNSGTITTRDSVPATIDSGSFSSASIADDTIVVTASVAQTFSFALSANTDALGSLDSATVATSPTPRTITVSTNANSGWLVWAKSATNNGLTSASSGDNITPSTAGAAATLAAGTKGYNLGLTTAAGTGTGVIATGNYASSGLGVGGGLDSTLRTIATSTGPNAGAVLTLKNSASISSSTAAATDYTDTETFVGAGLF